MRGWQIGCLLGLGVGLFQAMSGGMELATLPVDEGIIRLGVTMLGGAVFCGIAGLAVTAIATNDADAEPQNAATRLK